MLHIIIIIIINIYCYYLLLIIIVTISRTYIVKCKYKYHLYHHRRLPSFLPLWACIQSSTVPKPPVPRVRFNVQPLLNMAFDVILNLARKFISFPN